MYHSQWQHKCRQALGSAVAYIRDRGDDPSLMRKAHGHVNAAIAAAAEAYTHQLIADVLKGKKRRCDRNVREQIFYG